MLEREIFKFPEEIKDQLDRIETMLSMLETLIREGATTYNWLPKFDPRYPAAEKQ